MILQHSVLLAAFTLVAVRATSKYTDDTRPYKFGFNIQGHQHRHEEKDENGIIKGEYGFITADGYYRVTKYETDEKGDFKIISMKNYYVGFPPEDPTTTPPPPPRPNGRPLQYVAPTKSPPQPTRPTSYGTTAKRTPRPLQGQMGCSGCLIPTTKKPVPASEESEEMGPLIDYRSGVIHDENSPENKSKEMGELNLRKPPNTNSRTGISNGGNEDQELRTIVDGDKEVEPPRNYVDKLKGNNEDTVPIKPNKEAGLFGKKFTPNTDNRDTKGVGQLKPQGKDGIDQQPPGNSMMRPHPEPAVRARQPNQGRLPVQNGEANRGKEGKAELNPDDRLYTFNYTVGFHGHHEDGYRSGDKKGDYFVGQRDGKERKVEYLANEFGYQPNITFTDLSEGDARIPKEKTEKDFGLKGYEFKWFYRK